MSGQTHRCCCCLRSRLGRLWRHANGHHVVDTAGKTSTVAAEKAQESADTAGVEDYTIVGQGKRSADQAPDYFVTIDPVNLGSEEFKLDVKKVLRALAARRSSPAFSARVFDNTDRPASLRRPIE